MFCRDELPIKTFIELDNGLLWNSLQAIIWTKIWLVYWRIYV